MEKVAPFLKLDGDPYPAVVDGRIVWIVDGYTTLNNYPYSQRQTLGEVAADSRTGQGTRALPRQDVNYIRNSVKATVDAYTARSRCTSSTRTTRCSRPGRRPSRASSSRRARSADELRAHLRYPEDLFKVQRELLTRYHVTDPRQFFNSQDFWRVPADPTTGQGAAQPPYYIVAKAPGQERAGLPADQRAQRAAAGQPGRLRHGVQRPRATTARCRCSSCRGSQAVLGPGQVQGRFGSTPQIAQTVTLLNSARVQVKYGNLLTLPVGGGLLYIEPLYVQAAGNRSRSLQYVLVAFGDRAAFGPSLTGALDHVLRGGRGPAGTRCGPGQQLAVADTVGQRVRVAVRQRAVQPGTGRRGRVDLAGVAVGAEPARDGVREPAEGVQERRRGGRSAVRRPR